MNSRRHLSLVAAAATLLSTAPLATVFQSWSWLIDAIIMTGGVLGTAVLARSLRAPLWGQLLAMIAANLIVLTWLFAGGQALAGTIPDGATFRTFGSLLREAGSDMRNYGIPVPDRPGLLFLSTMGVGAVATVIDVCAVSLRRPAVAGLAMLPLYAIPVFVHTDGVAVLAFVAAGIGYLWLLVADSVDRVRRHGRRFTGDGRDVDTWEPSPLAAAGRRLGAVGIGLAIVLPLAIPGMTSGWLSGFGGPGSGGGTGVGGNGGNGLNLFALLDLNLKSPRTSTVLKVYTDNPNPFYLRVAEASLLDSDGFHFRPPGGGGSLSNLPGPVNPAMAAGNFRAEVQIINLNVGLAPVYSQVTHVTGLSGWRYDRRGDMVYSNRDGINHKVYKFDYVPSTFTVDDLRQAPPPSDAIKSDNTQPPDDSYVSNLVNGLVANKPTQYDRVYAIYSYFSAKNGFTYSLNVKGDNNASAIDAFLHHKAGFCQQYATAMAWMVRAAGYPARVAFGFTRGNPTGNGVYTITNNHYHTWTEVYFEGFGWVPFDPTPSGSQEGIYNPTWAPDNNTNQVTPTIPPGGNSPSTGPSGSTQNPAVKKITEDPLGIGAGGLNRGNPAHNVAVAVTLSLLILLVLLTVPTVSRRLLRRKRRPRRQGRAGPATEVSTESVVPGEMHVLGGTAADAVRREAHLAWEELLDTMVDYRIPVDWTETPRSTADRLVRTMTLPTEPADGVRTLGRAEERARYARQPLTDVDLQSGLRRARRAIAAKASRRTRLVATLMPPSVLLRWRRESAQAITAAVAGVGRWRDTMVRVASPRRLIRSTR